VLYAQNDSRRSSSNEGSSALTNVFVDEIGIRLISEGLSFETEIDPDIYVLGPLDALGITLKGPVNLIFRGLTVNPTGDITIPTVGAVRVSGLTLSEARAVISEQILPFYTQSEVLVTLDIPRMISVHLLGDIRQPGLRKVPAQTRLDALITGLGLMDAQRNRQSRPSNRRDSNSDDDNDLPSSLNLNSINEPIQSLQSEIPAFRNTGVNYLRTFSLRNIIIEHADGSQTRADLLGYYFGGMTDRNPVLVSGDRVMMKYRRVDSPRISISGAVQRPFNTEYHENDSLGDLLRMAGGLTDFALADSIFIFTSNSTSPQIVSADRADDLSVEPNSRIVVSFNNMDSENSASWIAGEVARPGSYPITNRVTTVREFIELAGGYTSNALPQTAFIERDISSNERVEFSQNPHYNRDLLSRTAPIFLNNLEYLEQEKQTSLKVIHVDLRNDFILDNTRLHDNDRLIIPRDQNTITVWGQVNNTGYFPFFPDFTVDDYIRQAGGAAISADLDRIYVIKAGTNVWFRPDQTTLESGDMIFIDRVPIENIETLRRYEIELAQQRNSNLGLIFTGLATISSIVTTVILLLGR
jgi:protein involved in polysaccharide export with SLBB domain